MIRLSLYILLLISLATAASTLDAHKDGEWISLGQPKYFHMGTDGRFYLNGTHQGSCAGVRPIHFRVDMSAPYFDKFYSWTLYMAAQKKRMDCVIKSGCGTEQVWVDYCRGSIE